jgi:hypothetical protein
LPAFVALLKKDAQVTLTGAIIVVSIVLFSAGANAALIGRIDPGMRTSS